MKLFYFTAVAILYIACQSGGQSTDNKAQSETTTPEPVEDTTAWTIFIGTYTKKEGHVDGKAKGAYVYRMQKDNGMLEQKATITGLINPSFLTASADKKYLFVVEETVTGEDTTGHINLLQRGADGNYLTLDRQSTRSHAPCHVAVDKGMKFAYVANYLGGIVSMFPIENGRLLPASFGVPQAGRGPHPEQDFSHPHEVVFSPDQRFIYVPDKGADRIFSYLIHPELKRITPLAKEIQARTTAGAGPRHLVFHPTLPFAYVVNELNSTVTMMAFNAQTGELRTLNAISTLPADYKGFNACAEIEITPDGRYLYASNRGHDSIAIFGIDSKTGALTALGHEPTRGAFPRDFTVSPDGRYLLAANQNSDNLVLFTIQPDGKLSFVRETQVPTPVCVEFR